MEQSQQITAFVAAPATTAAYLRGLLAKANVRAIDHFDLRSGDEYIQNVRDAIKQADFAVVAVPEDAPPNLWYEFGVCDGLSKPVLLILNADPPVPLSALHVHLRTKLDSRLIDVALKKFIEGLGHQSRPRKPRRSKLHALKRRSLNGIVEEIRDGRQHLKESRLIELVTRAIALRGAKSVVFSEPRDQGVDAVVQYAPLKSMLADPLYVELKLGDITEERLEIAESALQQVLSKSPAGAGIIIYLDRAGARFGDSGNLGWRVMRFDAEDFVRQLTNAGLDEVVGSVRNRIVHGGRG